MRQNTGIKSLWFCYALSKRCRNCALRCRVSFRAASITRRGSDWPVTFPRTVKSYTCGKVTSWRRTRTGTRACHVRYTHVSSSERRHDLLLHIHIKNWLAVFATLIVMSAKFSGQHYVTWSFKHRVLFEKWYFRYFSRTTLHDAAFKVEYKQTQKTTTIHRHRYRTQAHKQTQVIHTNKHTTIYRHTQIHSNTREPLNTREHSLSHTHTHTHTHTQTQVKGNSEVTTILIINCH